METEIPEDIIKLAMPEATHVPENMPTMQQLGEWDNLVGKLFIKFDPKTNKVFEKLEKVRYKPINLFPNHDIVKNRVTYRFNVAVVFGTTAVFSATEKKVVSVPQIIGDILIDVDKFLKEYKSE